MIFNNFLLIRNKKVDKNELIVNCLMQWFANNFSFFIVCLIREIIKKVIK